MLETRYGVCSARNESQSLSERELRIKNCVELELRFKNCVELELRFKNCVELELRFKNCVELELRFKNCVERIPGFPWIILSPFVFHKRHYQGCTNSSRRDIQRQLNYRPQSILSPLLSPGYYYKVEVHRFQ